MQHGQYLEVKGISRLLDTGKMNQDWHREHASAQLLDVHLFTQGSGFDSQLLSPTYRADTTVLMWAHGTKSHLIDFD